MHKYSALLPCVQRAVELLGTLPHKTVVVDIDDTLIFDDGRLTPNMQVRDLVTMLKHNSYKVHLVTARSKTPEMIRITKAELKQLKIPYDTLALAPEKNRKDMVATSLWKYQQRASHAPVSLSIGDQWSDFVQLSSEDDLMRWDMEHRTDVTPWLLVIPEDNITSLGMKLMA